MSGVIDVSRKVPAKLTLVQRLYLPEILRGMAVTFGHLARNLSNRKALPTISYPEQKREYSERFRGKHILKAREDGSLKCVACYMCQQACPAECITIVAGEHPKIAYEKYPVVFDIDMLRCVFCGFCVDACPKDAIWMTRNDQMAFFTREDAVFSIDRLRESKEEIAQHGYGYRPYYPGDGTTPPSDASMLPVLPGSGERDTLRQEGVRLPDRGPGPGPLNAPSQAQKSFSA